jgi:DNA transformation protein and related proteins
MPDNSFKEFVLDQLGALPELRARAMFGAHGLYSGDAFFGILDEGRLFFKTDVRSQSDYTARARRPIQLARIKLNARKRRKSKQHPHHRLI